MDKVRLGLIGLGAMGRALLDAARDHADVVMIASADVDDPMRIVRDANVEVVVIATPPDSHAHYAIAALEAGKAVFCEKPLASRLEDGARMVEAASRSGLVNLIHFPFCDRKPVLEIERASRAQELGPLRAVEIRLLFPTWPRDFQAHAHWLNTREQGGFLREVFTHFAYLTDRILGEMTVKNVDVMRTAPERAEHFVAARLSAADIPITVLGIAHAALPETYEWTLYGEKKSYRLTSWRNLECFDGGRWDPIAFTGDLGSERTRLTELARAVRGEATRLPDFATGYRIQRVVEALSVVGV